MNKNKYEISVIIPVYNAKDYLPRAISSVINQIFGFDNIELILYDDSSTDSSRQIILDYSKKYENIVPILSDNNSGYPGKGRNKGIKTASADFIMFMDNDDEYALDYCEKMYDAILYYDEDVVLCDWIGEDNISSYICKTNFSGDVIEKDNAIIFNKPIKNLNNMMLWNNIFRKSIIEQNNIKFPEDGLGEDCYFSYLSYMYANKVVYLNSYVGYIRHVQGSSLSRTLSFKKISEILSNLSKIVEKYNSNNHIPDYNFLFNANVRLAFKYIYMSQDFKNKNDIKNILKELYVFEKKNKF